MRTSKPIATISYNTEPFLLNKLQELIRNHKISDYMYIKHFPEEDERKEHIHLWLKPNTLLDTMDLQEFFRELDPSKPDKPLKCIDFRTSKTDDWILYNLHHSGYLASKGEAREFVYNKEDFRFYDEDNFEDLFKHALFGSEWSKQNQLLKLINEGSISPDELITSGLVPLQLTSQINSLYYMKTHYGRLDRGGRPNHEIDDSDSAAQNDDSDSAAQNKDGFIPL